MRLNPFEGTDSDSLDGRRNTRLTKPFAYVFLVTNTTELWIKGETDHYVMIINQVTGAVIQLNLAARIPITFGILTTDNIEQPLQQADLKAGNEDSMIAQSLLEMIDLNSQI